MKQYNVTGMSCAACSARVEKAVRKVPGVSACSVSLLTGSMGVEGSADERSVIAAVEQAGYGASAKSVGAGGNSEKISEYDDALADKETPLLKKRLAASVVFLLLLMYFSMGHTMWGWPLPAWFEGNHIAIGIVQLILSGIVMVINQKFFISGFKSLLKRAPNMDTLVALGSTASFMWSVYALLAMTGAQLSGNSAAVMNYMHEFYFESAAMILTLITVGKMLEAHSKGKTTDALRSLMKLSPKTAVLIRNGEEIEVSAAEVKKGDIFVVRSGENIPVDGIIIDGSCAVNESSLTGESIPVDKTLGDTVSAATINQSGFIRCEAQRVGEDTTISQIIKMVSESAATKAPIAKIADRVSGVFVPIVISIAAVTTLVWLALGQTAGFALARGISVLVISCPCALGLATPVAIMVGSGLGAKNGILFKTAASLEETGRVRIAALDKTGTITKGEPKVTDIIPAQGVSETELLETAFALELKSEHPLARAVTEKCRELSVEARDTADFRVLPGNGLSASLALDGQELVGGSLKFISGLTNVPKSVSETAGKLSENGKTPLLFMKAGKLCGIIAVADLIKEESPAAIRELRSLGVRVVMLTGDNEKTANAIGAQAGVDEVIAGVLPDGKASVVKDLKKHGKTIMVGDGINDAPALVSADIGMAIGAGTDAAIDAAEVVLMKSSLADVPAAIKLSRAVLRNIRENLFWAFIYNIIGIPLAAGVFVCFGITLNPMFGAAAMSLSSFCVVSNALRLNFCKIYEKENRYGNRSNKNKLSSLSLNKNGSNLNTNININTKEKGNKTMNKVKTMKIEGMMCGHCEARVKKALEAMSEVESAEVSHANGTAVVTLKSDISDDALKGAVEAQDYKVTSVV